MLHDKVDLMLVLTNEFAEVRAVSPAIHYQLLLGFAAAFTGFDTKDIDMMIAGDCKSDQIETKLDHLKLVCEEFQQRCTTNALQNTGSAQRALAC